ncbi:MULTISPECIES: HNH endonuclease [unclassified Roseibium]|uniref:HNH endonuclease n=1 Tax=unclassified Roseibium TaxID=2629323 RepID=UPI00273D9785|nr:MULTISPECIES: HNH endonuclease [unclassified Roseibium]
MLAAKQALIRREVEEGTGAGIALEQDRSGLQSGLKLWFSDLSRSNSPIVVLRPTGLHRMVAELTFGNFAAETIRQIQGAEPEEIQLARALVSAVARNAQVTFSGGQSLDNWLVDGGDFRILAEKRGIEARFEDDGIIETCRELVIPILAAMAELYGYDAVEEISPPDQELLIEGAVKLALVRKRERNPRNRLLCLRVHGSVCKICDLDPMKQYGEAGSIIEVHHVQPLSLAGEPRAYDPALDLIPVCPNCHRALHTRRPVPWTPEELAERLGHG